MDDKFKYALGSRFRRALATYHVVGHSRFVDGTRGYVVNTWDTPTATGYAQLTFDAWEVENDPHISAVEGTE